MNIENQLEAIEGKTADLLAAAPGYFLVEVSIKPVNNIKVFIDADQGAAIDYLTKVNRALYKYIEESGFFPDGDFSLKVSSPGLDEPLKLNRQYLKNIGRQAEVVLKNGIKKEGKLISAGDNEIVIEEEKGKREKKEINEKTNLKKGNKRNKNQGKI